MTDMVERMRTLKSIFDSMETDSNARYILDKYKLREVLCGECKGEGLVLVKRGPSNMIMDYAKTPCPTCSQGRTE